MALIAVMLLLMAMSALAAALAISSTTETLISRNHENAAQARAAAEAGLGHALDLTLDFLSGWQAAGFTSVDVVLDTLLTDPTTYITGLTSVTAGITLVGDGSTYSAIEHVGSFTNISYEASIFDDDDITGRDIALTSDDVTRMGEPGADPDDDENKMLVVRAIGYAGGNAVAAVEATIAAREMPAILSDDDFDAAGSFGVSGGRGTIHTNRDFTHTGTGFTTEGCTASVASETASECTPGASSIEVPDVRACTYVGAADYVLHADGTMTTVSTPGTCAFDEATDEWIATFVDTAVACDPCANGWEFDGGQGTWTLESTPLAAVYYIEGKDTDVKISANGTLTILTEGDIVDGTGGNLTPIAGLSIVADGDINTNAGSPNIGSATQPGLIVVGEQMDLRGNVTIYGQIIIRNARTYSGEVTATQLSGSVQIIYGGGLDGQFFTVSAWRRSY
jgi:hypothetical protein